MSKVWLITGSANGLGRDIAESALEAGELVIASARNPEQSRALVMRYGERVRIVKHDVTHEVEAHQAVQAALDAFGRLDVVVNNAGYSRFGPFEQISDDDFKDIVDTCFYGVVYTTRAALPVMRRQRQGVIFQVSSLGGRLTRPGNSPYHAAKWAVSGFSEALAQETAPFGVQVCCLEPGGIRTNWGKRASANLPPILSGYEESVGRSMHMLQDYWGNENSDPKLIARLLIGLADAKGLPPHLLLGSDAVNYLKQADESRTESAEKWRDVSVSVDFGGDSTSEGNAAPAER
jgi:NAD(P)-dependent dehydrogenase (short-subunit alcohol dehydrogenase family)